MRHMMREVLLFTVILSLSVFGGSCTGQPAGPWKAQVVDSETRKPLEEVVVLAYWLKMTRTPGGPSPQFYDAEEVLTGDDGRFTIPSRWTFMLNPLKYIKDPEFIIFKPGYGRWRTQDWEKKPKQWEELTVGEVLAKDDIVIELPPLKTRAKRLRFYDSLRWSPSSLVPPDRTKRLDEAVKKERDYLGFRN